VHVVSRSYPPAAKTLEMTPGPFPRISVTPATPGPDLFLAVPVDIGGDTIRLVLRLACGFQPYFENANQLPEWFRVNP
jgi:hypothetical protein